MAPHYLRPLQGLERFQAPVTQPTAQTELARTYVQKGSSKEHTLPCATELPLEGAPLYIWLSTTRAPAPANCGALLLPLPQAPTAGNGGPQQPSSRKIEILMQSPDPSPAHHLVEHTRDEQVTHSLTSEIHKRAAKPTTLSLGQLQPEERYNMCTLLCQERIRQGKCAWPLGSRESRECKAAHCRLGR